LQLRSDDPTALKEIILQVQDKYKEQQQQHHKQKLEQSTAAFLGKVKAAAASSSTTADEASDSSKEFDARARFMLDMIYDLKNNRKAKGSASQANATTARLMSIIHDTKPAGRAKPDQIRVTWQQATDPERGKWWLINQSVSLSSKTWNPSSDQQSFDDEVRRARSSSS